MKGLLQMKKLFFDYRYSIEGDETEKVYEWERKSLEIPDSIKSLKEAIGYIVDFYSEVNFYMVEEVRFICKRDLKVVIYLEEIAGVYRTIELKDFKITYILDEEAEDYIYELEQNGNYTLA